MTVIKRTKECLKSFKRDFEKGLFSEDDGRVLKLWALEMEQFGPQYIEDSLQWRDHPLEREWKGYRASCFSKAGRIIYRILDDETIEVCEIERITPNHNYKK